MKMEIHFAPLQGFTTYIYRRIHNIIYGNINKYYSPFVRLESGSTFRNKDIKDICTDNNKDIEFVPQIIAGNAEEASILIEKVMSEGYRQIDINMGCPFPLITKKGKGAGILQYPDRVKSILDLLDRYEDTTFSLKIRSGMNDANECLALADMINNSRIACITLHPRTGTQQYKGQANRDAFIDFARLCSKPVIYNGDLKTIEDIRSMEGITENISGVMIGRGLLENPALAMEYKNGVQLDDARKRELIYKFHMELFNEYSRTLQGDNQILSHLQPLWEYMYPEMEKKLRKKITKCTKLGNYLKSIDDALL